MTAAAQEFVRNMAGRQLGRYEVLSQLASGGMAAVYVARARGVAGFERLVAIKVLHPHLAYEEEFISMFLDEARLAARIRHPNVVPTLDISDTEGDGFFLVMEYIEGDHLGALLQAAARAGSRLAVPIVVRLILDALGGLGAAHRLCDEQGEPLHLVHRDVSPHNVMVGVDGIGRITDFGVAKAEKRLTSTRAGQFKGKLAYMAPEQASTGFADQRSDLFSMGIILWESLTGRRLFRGENNASTLNKILQEPIPRVSDIYPELASFDPILLKALDRNPDCRFQSADEFSEALEAVALDGPGVATPRQVAAEVRERLQEKLEEQRSRVRAAIERLGHSDIGETAIPIPRDGSRSSVSLPRKPSSPDAVTLTAPPELEAHGTKGRRRALWWGALAAALLLAGGTLTVALFSDKSEPTPPPAAATPPTSEANEPEPEPVPESAPPSPNDRAAPQAAADAEETSDERPRADEAESEGTAEPRRTQRRRRHRPRGHRGSHQRRANSEGMTEPSPPTPMEEPPPPPAMVSMSAADDLIFNPYRR